MAGGFAFFFGPSSPLNADGWMGPIRAISTASSHPSLEERLEAAGFERVETQNVLIGDLREMTGALDARVFRATDLRAWGRAGGEVYADGDAPPPDIDVSGDMGSLIFGNTLAWARGRGLQSALIRHRIALLQEAGVAYVRAMASAGSSSERNAMRAELKIAFARTLWELHSVC